MAAPASRLPADFVDRLRDLLSTVQAVQHVLRPEPVDDRLDRIVRLAATVTRAEAGLLYLVHEDRGDLHVAAAFGAGARALVGRFVARTTSAGFVIEDGNPLAVADPAPASSSRDEIDAAAGTVTRSLLVVPLLVHGRAAGALELRNAPAREGFSPADMELCAELALLAAAAVEEYRGDRFLFALFAAALPRALDASRGPERDGLAEELERWLVEVRQTPAYRGVLDLVSRVRELSRSGEDAVTLARQVLDALVERERRRRTPA